MNKWWHLLKLKFDKKYRQSVIEQEYKNSKKHRYATFEEFLRDCPEYQIGTDFISCAIRKIYSVAGVKFQQWVFIDPGAQEDKTAWIRREKNYILHEKGTYFLPWKSNKSVMYYDLYDSRPLIDLTEEMDWRNQDMTADVVTAVTNSKNMNDLRGNTDPYSKYSLYILIACVIQVLILIGLLYTLDKNQKATEATLNNIYNLVNSSRLVTVIGK